ncbi:hypothetical protein AVEN_259954-1 [Araneus ventricosus]|uniref:Uncharacterized protein n=1 Tax=Araneus ventricosus TaxID=182803 RepID=A0A4Y2UFL3_ARAVE|nr:hypothetical protein AVEN_259954-1 [Araneus ventricosus]
MTRPTFELAYPLRASAPHSGRAFGPVGFGVYRARLHGGIGFRTWIPPAARSRLYHNATRTLIILRVFNQIIQNFQNTLKYFIEILYLMVVQSVAAVSYDDITRSHNFEKTN